jgi:hypothetical protein
MLRGLILLMAGAALLGGCRRGGAATHARGADSCQWTGGATVLHQAGDTLYQVWSLAPPAAQAGWQPADLPALTSFRRAVEARLEAANVLPDAAGLLRRQVAHYAARGHSDSRREAENGRLVLDGAVGTMRPLSCLEALLLDFQARRFPMVDRPTELQAFVLRRNVPAEDSSAAAADADTPALVYFAASGAPWPPGVGRLVPLLESKVREGWRVIAHVHNHPFYLDRLTPLASGPPTSDIAGALAPSITDVRFYRSMHAGLGLETALVTNGFATLEIPAASFGRLHARGEQRRP